ncbi:MAG: VIT domain-containing protein [Ignavibacteriales bacterium]
MKRFTALMLFFISLTVATFASDYLRILDPQSPSRSMIGTIEETTVSMHPSGLYMEYDLYLTISAKGWYYSPNDQLEVEFNFDLPEGAIVKDLWLWVGKDIMKALILDKWTASTIYENIVKRRRDPAILYKMNAYGNNQYNTYQLRVYPIMANSSRKVKISYLVPMQWMSKMTTVPLPVNLLRASYKQPETFSLLLKSDGKWKNPRILELQNLDFRTVNDSLNGTYLKADVPLSTISGPLTAAFDSPMQKGFFAGNYKKNDEGIYQIALLPSEVLDIKQNRKVAIMLNYELNKSPISPEEILGSLKSLLTSGFNSSDSFNIFLNSEFSVKSAGSKWLPADSATVRTVFDMMAKNKLVSYSSISGLIPEAINFIKANGNNGSMLLISNSDDLGDFTPANALIKYLLDMMKPVLPIHIADFGIYSRYYYIGNRYYIGNEYLYTNLSRQTYAEYQIHRGSGKNVSQILDGLLQGLNGFINTFDIYTTLQNGFCYGRYNITGNDQALYLSKPVLQIGKFKGSFPLKVQISGVFEGNTFSKEYVVDSLGVGDSLLETAWSGNYLAGLEQKPQTNNIINQIIYESMHSRILTQYTTFLALEPGDTIRTCTTCKDESGGGGGGTSVSPAAFMRDTLLVQGYPNPFNAQVNLNVFIPQKVSSRDVSCRIVNILGQVVRTFEVGEPGENRMLKISWDGRNNNGEMMASGVYIFVVNTPSGRQSLKLMMLK